MAKATLRVYGEERLINVADEWSGLSAANEGLIGGNPECQRLALFPKLLRNDGSRLIFECVSEAPDRQP